MGSLKEALTVERSRLFVGRERELAYMQNWLEQPEAPTEAVFISGIGGIGKSALMLQFLNMGQDEDMLCIWLDGRVCTETPAGFIESLHTFLSQNSRIASVSKPSMADIVAVMSQQRTLLCIDNYENLHQIEGWLRGVFLPRFSDTGLLVVLAARQELAVDWQKDLAWRQRVKQLRLAPIMRLEARGFYANLGVDKEPQIEQLIYETKGLPLAMALSAERIKLGSETTAWPISMLVSAELMREVATSELQEILDLLCILPQANPELLNRFLDAPLTALKLHQLSQLSFVRPTVGGFALHDVARTQLLEDFLHREPIRSQSLRLGIVEELSRDLKQADFKERKRMAAHLLSICRDAFRLGSISIISTNPHDAVLEPFQNGDLPYLHRLMTEQGKWAVCLESESKVHELLDALAAQFPQSIRVFRSAEGIPLAFTSGLLLYRETAAFLESFFPGVLDVCFPLEAGQMKQLCLEEADTYYQLLGASAVNDAVYSFYELSGILLTDSFSRNWAAGMRAVLVTKLEEMKELNLKLGFRITILSGLPDTHPSSGACIHDLDLRKSDFGEYVLRFLSGAPQAGQTAPDPALTEGDIKTALPLVGDAIALERSDLARKLNCTGPHLQQMLQKIIFHKPPAFPMDSRKQALLQLFCDEPALNAELAAERLHISRATYYRNRSEAMGELKELLSVWKAGI